MGSPWGSRWGCRPDQLGTFGLEDESTKADPKYIFCLLYGVKLPGYIKVSLVFTEQHDGFCELSQERARRLGENCALRASARSPSDSPQIPNPIRISGFPPFLSL